MLKIFKFTKTLDNKVHWDKLCDYKPLYFQSVNYKHKDLQYLKSVPSKDEGVKTSMEHDLFKWGEKESQIQKLIKQNLGNRSSPPPDHHDTSEGEPDFYLVDAAIDSEEASLHTEEPCEDEWATDILGKLVPNEDTLDRVYGDSQMSFSEIPICFIKTSQNNTIIDVRDPAPHPFLPGTKATPSYEQLCYSSCGVEGFKNAKKGTNVAGQAVGLSVATKCMQKGIKMVRVVVRGLGPGRMASVKGLQMGGLQIVSITDNTPIPFNGTRPRKQRKV